MKIHKTSQHGDITIIEGNKKQVLEDLRVEARTKRRESRLRHNLTDDVHSIDKSLHQSELVTMASFKLENKGLNDLIELLNSHGVTNYKIVSK
jgi:plasmid maintenance system killer protein